MKLHKELFKWTKASPNKVHELLAYLNIPVITESIDGLFLKVGHKKLIELNGNLNNIVCINCNYKSNLNLISEFTYSKCPICLGILKPDIVFIGENLRCFDVACNEIYKADLLIIIGSDLNLWPANKLIATAQKQNCKIINIRLP